MRATARRPLLSIRRLAVALRRIAGGRCFLALVCAAWLAAHLWRLDDPPAGFHEWREADTCSVAWSLHAERFDPLRPRINVRGNGDGVIGQELPLLNAAIAAGWGLLGDGQHAWARLLSVLSGVALIVGVRRVLLDLGWPRTTAGLAAAAAACSPLLFFYGRKIIPDVPAGALALWGAIHARRWIARGGAGAGVAGAVGLALAGAMKPLTLCVGLPLAAEALARDGRRALVRIRLWFFAACCTAPAVLWFAHARRLDNKGYFLIGVPWRRSAVALLDGQPLGKLLVEWPWQMWVGLGLVVPFLIGCASVARRRRLGWVGWWLAGAFAVLLPFAAQFGPHDYYTLVMVAPCAALTGAGLAAALAARRRWLQATALVLLLAAGPLAFVRMKGRYGAPYDHAAIRADAARALPKDALVVAYDRVPAALLYRLGRNGWWIHEPAALVTLPELARRGAGFVTARGERRAGLAGHVGELVIQRDDLAVWRLPPPR